MEGTWRKSSYSDNGDANCVELSLTGQGLLVRDSKSPDSGMLSVTDGGASAFVSAVKAGLYQR